MAHVILGLLLLRPMSLYDLLKAFEEGISLFYSASAGSIKRALDGLLRRGQVEIVSQDVEGRRRKTYGITDAGRAAFQEWILSPPERADMDTAVLSRVYFLGLLDATDRLTALEQLRTTVAAEAATLEVVESQVATSEVPAELGDVARYGRATLDYGIRAHQTALTWLDELLGRAEADAEKGAR